MANLVKTHNIPADGSTVLFSVPEPYLNGTLSAIATKVGEVSITLTVTELGEQFFTVSPTPANTWTVELTYSIDVTNISDGKKLTDIEHANLKSLLEAVVAQQEALQAMQEALLTRVTTEDFNAWASVMEKELEDIKSTVLLLSSQ